MKYPDESIGSVGALVHCLKRHLRGIEAPVWFRGQARSDWKLVPKLLRDGGAQKKETYLIRRFKQNATLLLPRHPKNDFEWLFLMQHYSLSTRLLDWTESPLVALYFAVTEHNDADGALWVLLPTELNAISNYRPDYALEIPSFEDEHLQNYLPETVAGEHRTRLLPVAAIAPRNNPRMQAQQGVFTISHRDNTPVEDSGTKNHVWRYTISSAVKSPLQAELKTLGITRFQLFPELDSLAQL